MMEEQPQDHGIFDFRGIDLELPSLHGMIFVGQLDPSSSTTVASTVGGPTPKASVANSGQPNVLKLDATGNSNTTCETVKSAIIDFWEKRFREIGEDNSERNVSGVMLFQPGVVTGYCESNEEGLNQCVRLLNVLNSTDSSKLTKVKIVHLCFNLEERTFNTMICKGFESQSGTCNVGGPGTDLTSFKREFQSKMPKGDDRSFENQATIVVDIFNLLMFIRKQAPMSAKKALDLLSDKTILPDPHQMEAILNDNRIPDPSSFLQRQNLAPNLTLAEDVVWPMPKEAFQLNVHL